MPEKLIAPAQYPPEILARIVGFFDHLRQNGLNVGPSEAQDALCEVFANSTGSQRDDCQKLKALLTGTKQEWDGFDDLFESYWIGKGKIREQVKKSGASYAKSRKIPQLWSDHFEKNDTKGNGPKIESEEGSDTGQLASGKLVAVDQISREKTDLRQFVDSDEIARAEALALRLAQAMKYRLSRRFYASQKSNRLDMRRTIRASLKYGGTPVDLRFRSNPPQPVRIVVFLDVSGSMQHYSRFFLQFVKGLVSQWARVDAFIFHTRLVCVTDALRDTNPMRSMTRLSLMADGFGGGTKLGECLDVFNRQYAKKTLGSRTVVMIFSDGYEVGSPENLGIQLAKIKKRAMRLIWLNPLLGWKNYEPVTAAIKIALPYTDHFAAANTLETLAAIEPELARM